MFPSRSRFLWFELVALLAIGSKVRRRLLDPGDGGNAEKIGGQRRDRDLQPRKRQKAYVVGDEVRCSARVPSLGRRRTDYPHTLAALGGALLGRRLLHRLLLRLRLHCCLGHVFSLFLSRLCSNQSEQ